MPKLNTEITVDGNLDDPAWEVAGTIFLENITQPYENLPSPVQTKVRYFEMDTLYTSPSKPVIPTPKLLGVFIISAITHQETTL